MNTCKFSGQLGRCYDGEANAAELVEMQGHLKDCPQCAAGWAGLERLSARLAAVDWAWPEGALARVHARLDQQAERALLQMARTLLAVAASLLLVLSLWVIAQGSQSVETTPPAWDTVAREPASADPSATTSPQVAVAEWVVDDLSRGPAHE